MGSITIPTVGCTFQYCRVDVRRHTFVTVVIRDHDGYHRNFVLKTFQERGLHPLNSKQGTFYLSNNLCLIVFQSRATNNENIYKNTFKQAL